MMKFACFERTIELLYEHVVPKPREKCTYEEQLAVTFAAGYIAGVFCAVVSHPADTLVSKMNQQQGCTAMQMVILLFLIIKSNRIDRSIDGSIINAKIYIYITDKNVGI